MAEERSYGGFPSGSRQPEKRGLNFVVGTNLFEAKGGVVPPIRSLFAGPRHVVRLLFKPQVFKVPQRQRRRGGPKGPSELDGRVQENRPRSTS